MNRLEKKFLREVRARRLIAHGDKVLVAVSGGSDSMALLSLLSALQPLLHCQLAVAHCNFQLRGAESDGDESFVRAHALSFQLDCFVERFETERYAQEWKKSLEETARILRYTFFEQVMVEHGFSRVATGHHVNDNAETILFNLFRGVSLSGLRGIRARNGKIIRPMLLLHKDDIEAYLEQKGVASRIDASNGTDEYDRNFIRNRVIPLIEERFAHKLLPALGRLSNQAGELEEFLELYFENLCKRESGLTLSDGKLDVKALKRLTVFEQKELFKRALRDLNAPVDAKALQKLVDLLNGHQGKMVMAGRALRVVWKGGSFYFLRDTPPLDEADSLREKISSTPSTFSLLRPEKAQEAAQYE